MKAAILLQRRSTQKRGKRPPVSRSTSFRNTYSKLSNRLVLELLKSIQSTGEGRVARFKLTTMGQFRQRPLLPLHLVVHCKELINDHDSFPGFLITLFLLFSFNKHFLFDVKMLMTLFTFQNLFQNDTDVQSRLFSDLSYRINSRAMPVSWNSWIFVQIPVCLTINYILYWLCHITSFITSTTKLYRKEQNSTKVEFGIVIEIEICDKLWPIYWLHDLTLHNQSITKCYWLNIFVLAAPLA